MGFKIGKIAQTALGGVSGLLNSGDSGLSNAAAGLVSGAVGVGMDLLTNRNNLEQQQALQDDAFAKNLQMWNLNNAYNDPAAQMERLKAAKLNTNLVYGGGNVTGNTSGSTPTYTAPDYSPVDKSVQRAQLGLALQEHQQRITNQAIENELARERIGLATREADREDRLADAQIKAYAANLGLGIERNSLTRENNLLLSEDRADRIAHMKYKSAHDDWLKRVTNLQNAKFWNVLSKREQAKMMREYGLAREPQLKDYY